MRKLCFLLFTMSLLCIQSCTDKDSDAEPTKDILLGSWNFTKLINENGIITKNGNLESTFSLFSSNESGEIEFNEKGQYSSQNSFTNNVTVKTSGSEEEFKEEVNSPLNSGEYTHDKVNNIIILFGKTASTVYNIEVLSETELILTTKGYKSTIEGNITTIQTSDVKATYTR